MGAEAVRVPLPVRLSMPDSPGEGFTLLSGSCIIGAGSEADFVVRDRTVSREHVRLTLVPEGVQVTDLGSRNGTFHGGHRVTEIVLSIGTRLRLGRAELCIDLDPLSLQGAGTEAGYGCLQGRSQAMGELFAKLRPASRGRSSEWISFWLAICPS